MKPLKNFNVWETYMIKDGDSVSPYHNYPDAIENLFSDGEKIWENYGRLIHFHLQGAL